MYRQFLRYDGYDVLPFDKQSKKSRKRSCLSGSLALKRRYKRGIHPPVLVAAQGAEALLTFAVLPALCYRYACVL
jgi:hypothetical protein